MGLAELYFTKGALEAAGLGRPGGLYFIKTSQIAHRDFTKVRPETEEESRHEARTGLDR
jgi:hypothetical protein